MANKTKRAKRSPACRADAEDDTWAKRTGLYLHLWELRYAEELARSIGPEGIAERHLDHARDDPKFQSFLDRVLRGDRVERRAR
jgi:aminoglycoside phosphotransferase (APT) family kinase protein